MTSIMDLYIQSTPTNTIINSSANRFEDNISAQRNIGINSADISGSSQNYRNYIVKPGDSLSAIAKREYGSFEHYKLIVALNPQIKNPDRINVGDVIKLPAKNTAQNINAPTANINMRAGNNVGNNIASVYTVKPGDSLSAIAQDKLGSVKKLPELLRANPQIKNPDYITVGQKINIPAADGGDISSSKSLNIGLDRESQYSISNRPAQTGMNHTKPSDNGQDKAKSKIGNDTKVTIDINQRTREWVDPASQTITPSVTLKTKISPNVSATASYGSWVSKQNGPNDYIRVGLGWKGEKGLSVGASAELSEKSQETKYIGTVSYNNPDVGSVNLYAKTDGRRIADIAIKPAFGEDDLRFGTRWTRNDIDTPNREEFRIYARDNLIKNDRFRLSAEAGMLSAENNNGEVNSFPYIKAGASLSLSDRIKLYANAENKTENADELFTKIGIKYNF